MFTLIPAISASFRERQYAACLRILLSASPVLVLALSVLIGLTYSVLVLAPTFTSLDEAGYPDSYVLFDALRAGRTGTIYPEFSQPPYLPVVYGPWLYLLIEGASRLFHFDNPFLGPRIMMFGWYLACLLLTFLIAKKLWQRTAAAVLSLLVAASCSVIPIWILQLRTDFPSIACALLSIRLLLSRRRGMILAAGLFAGAAIVFRYTMVAAAAGGFLWLVSSRRYRRAGEFAMAVTATVLGVSAWFTRSEPRMFQHIFAHRNPVFDGHGLVDFADQFVREPVAWLALAAIIHMKLRGGRLLLLIFMGLSFSIASVTGLQAGANIDYFYECLFAMAVFSGYAALKLPRWGHARPVLAGVCSILVLYLSVGPLAQLTMQQASRLRLAGKHNQAIRSLEKLLDGRQFLSDTPRVAFISKQPTLMEPFLLSLLSSNGRADTGIWTTLIAQRRYEVIVMQRIPLYYRGIYHLHKEIRAAIDANYSPYCQLYGYRFYLPVNGGSGELQAGLDQAGCVAVSPAGRGGGAR
jgi:Dolichyl-phosphate-mannose-protein mannosyltransferase